MKISPSSVVTVNPGNTTAFTVRPDAGPCRGWRDMRRQPFGKHLHDRCDYRTLHRYGWFQSANGSRPADNSKSNLGQRRGDREFYAAFQRRKPDKALHCYVEARGDQRHGRGQPDNRQRADPGETLHVHSYRDKQGRDWSGLTSFRPRNSRQTARRAHASKGDSGQQRRHSQLQQPGFRRLEPHNRLYGHRIPGSRWNLSPNRYNHPVAPGSGNSVVVPNLTNGLSYRFTVKATNALGTGPASSYSNRVTPTAAAGAQ